MMFEKLFWFGLGYLTARYLILKNGVEAYSEKEGQIINTGKDKIGDIRDEYMPEEDYQNYIDYEEMDGGYY